VATVPLGPAPVDLTGVRAGDQNALTLTLAAKNAPYNLTGKIVTAQARLTPTAAEHLDAVVTIVDAPGGTLQLRWPGAAVTAILAGKDTWKGVWDLQIADPGQDAITVVAGSFSAVMDVTRTGP
jgi:hypothetical protein